MAKETLLESDIAAGANLIEALDQDGEQIDAALWFYYPDLSQWKLLLRSPTFDRGNITGAYTKVSQVLSGKDDVNLNISISDIKIISTKDPLMNLLKSILHIKGLNQVRMRSNIFNGIYVEDALIYRNI